MKQYYLAVDIGASSGRHIIGYRGDGGKIETDEVYRFANGVTRRGGLLCWDIDKLFESVVIGIKAAFEKYPHIASLAIDTWGVDYVLLNGDERSGDCISYRAERTEQAVKRVHEILPFSALYARTGIQFQPFNTVYQLFDDNNKGRLDKATDFLMIPEYLTYKLTGIKRHEYTNATTTGLVDATTGEYDGELISALGLPKKLFGKIDRAKTAVGMLRPEIAARVGGNTRVVLAASHDTASAVEGIPFDGNAPYISSGTWSLLGVKLPSALTDEKSMRANYSNEGGVGYVRYQKNIMGMWVVNRLRDELCKDAPWSEIVKGARASGFKETVDVNADIFRAPASMKDAFDSALERRPRDAYGYFNSAYLSLAKSYCDALDELSDNTGVKYGSLYIVGGGAKNDYLNALTEQACGVKVIALPIEATAIGNIKIQSGTE